MKDKNKSMFCASTGTSFDENIRLNTYYCKTAKCRQEPEYLALYKDKGIKAIGKIKKVIEGKYSDGELHLNLVYGEEIIDKDIDLIYENIRKSNKLFNCNIGTQLHKYFIVDKFLLTDYRKITPGGLQGYKYFNLYELLNTESLPDCNEIAKILNNKVW